MTRESTTASGLLLAKDRDRRRPLLSPPVSLLYKVPFRHRGFEPLGVAFGLSLVSARKFRWVGESAQQREPGLANCEDLPSFGCDQPQTLQPRGSSRARAGRAGAPTAGPRRGSPAPGRGGLRAGFLRGGHGLRPMTIAKTTQLLSQTPHGPRSASLQLRVCEHLR